MSNFSREGWYNIGLRHNEKIIDVVNGYINRDISVNISSSEPNTNHSGAQIFFANVGTFIGTSGAGELSYNEGIPVDGSKNVVSFIDASNTFLHFTQNMLKYPTGWFDASLVDIYTISGEYSKPDDAKTFKAKDWVEIVNQDSIWDMSLNFGSNAHEKTTIGAWLFLDTSAGPVNMTITHNGSKEPVYTNNSTIDLTFTSNKDTTDFLIGDITLTNLTTGELSNFTGSGQVYTVTVTPGTDGIYTFEVPANKFTDTAGISNEASNPFSWTRITENPTLQITVGGAATNGVGTHLNTDTQPIVVNVPAGTNLSSVFSITKAHDALSSGTSMHLSGSVTDNLSSINTAAAGGPHTLTYTIPNDGYGNSSSVKFAITVDAVSSSDVVFGASNGNNNVLVYTKSTGVLKVESWSGRATSVRLALYAPDGTSANNTLINNLWTNGTSSGGFGGATSPRSTAIKVNNLGTNYVLNNFEPIYNGNDGWGSAGQIQLNAKYDDPTTILLLESSTSTDTQLFSINWEPNKSNLESLLAAGFYFSLQDPGNALITTNESISASYRFKLKFD